MCIPSLRHSLVLAVLASAVGCSSLPPSSSVATSYATHDYVVAGSGQPVVVLEAGLGDGRTSWVPVFGRLAEQTTVFAYDRAGYSGSRSAETRRDGLAIVRELRATLLAVGLGPPYVLVGHSLGGSYMELYARMFPGEVSGLVLVDARHPEFTQRCLAEEARFCEPPPLLVSLLPEAARRELAAAEATESEVLAAGPMQDIPTVVLTGMSKTVEGEKFRSVWLETQKELAGMSSLSRHDVCDYCGHYIHRDDPDRVIDAVLEVVDFARRRSSRAGS